MFSLPTSDLNRSGDGMKLSNVEKETIINFNEGERTASV